MPFLLLDSGNALFDSEISRNPGSLQSITARGIADVYAEMDYDAVNVGPADMAAGIDFLLELDKVPWVSANFFTPSGDPVFHEYLIRKIEHFSLAIIGLTSPPVLPEESFVYRHWEEVLPPLIARVSEEAEFIILLSALPQQENLTLARRFPQIRIIFSADLSRTNAPPRLINNAIITQTAYQGRYLGRLGVANGKATTWQRGNISRQKIEQQIQSLESRINRFETLSVKTGEKPQAIAVLSAEKKKLQNLLKKHQQEPHGKTSSYEVGFTPLTTSIPEEKKISSIVAEIKRKIHFFYEEKRRKYQQE